MQRARVVWLSDLTLAAAWPGLLVVVAHSVLGDIFGHEPYVDPTIHFLGGVAAAFFFSRLGPYVPEVFGGLAPAARRTLAFTATTTVAVLWEFAEYLVDLYFGTQVQISIGNTLRDILNGMLGAGTCLLADYLIWRKAAASARL
jgi:hypothetical protein